MPNDWEDDIDGSESQLVKDLRAQIKAKANELKAAQERIATLEPQVRSSSLSSILSELNIKDPRVAKLMPNDLDVTKENVEAWLSEYGDLFNIQAGQTAGASEAQQQQAEGGQGEASEDWQRFQAQSNATGATTPDMDSQQIALLQRANEASGGNVDTYFAMLRGEIPIPS